MLPLRIRYVSSSFLVGLHRQYISISAPANRAHELRHHCGVLRFLRDNQKSVNFVLSYNQFSERAEEVRGTYSYCMYTR